MPTPSVADKHLAVSRLGTHYQILWCTVLWLGLNGCTRGHLDYVTPQGEHKAGCHTEYSWAPAVDKHAVDYVLAYCAKGALAQGHQVKDQRLLQLDLTIPAPPLGQRWSHELAATQHKAGQITDQQYGYVVAYLDLGLDQPPATPQQR